MSAEKPPPPDDDLALVLEAQRGGSVAFEALVLKHQNMIAGILHRFAPSPSELDDLVQDALLKVWNGLATWSPDRPFVHWLKRVAYRTGLESYRKRKRLPLVRGFDLRDESVRRWEEMPAEAGGAAAALEEIHLILSHLSPDDRRIIHLSCIEELPVAEISELLGWSPSKVKVRAFRARQKLRKILVSHGYH